MLKSALPYKDTFESLSIQDSNFTNCPSADEWEDVSLRASQAGQKTALNPPLAFKYYHIFFISRLLAVLTS
jgi:hypothetical protein